MVLSEIIVDCVAKKALTIHLITKTNYNLIYLVNSIVVIKHNRKSSSKYRTEGEEQRGKLKDWMKI